jgi:hypothetical protein
MSIRRERHELLSTKQTRPEGEYGALILWINGSQKERVTAILIADDRPRAVGSAEESRGIDLCPHSITHGVWHREAERTGEEQVVEVELRRVLVVSDGPLVVHAVAQDLYIELRLENLLPEGRPIGGPAQLREHQADIQETEAFTREVSVRAVVNGVESLDVPRVVPQ